MSFGEMSDVSFRARNVTREIRLGKVPGAREKTKCQTCTTGTEDVRMMYGVAQCKPCRELEERGVY